MSDGNDVWESSGCGTKDVLEDNEHTSGFSEHELLDIMYNACNTSNTGEVLASTIVQYLQNMTAQSPQQDRLAALRQLLDPDSLNPHVSRETFHSAMREWIAQCSQDSADVEASHVSWPDSSKVPVNGLDLSFSQSKAASPESHQCSCDGKDLSSTVAELKHAHRKLSEQNSSLLKTVAQCEDINLQLTLEITELRGKLVSAQRSAVRARSLTDELEETRRAFKEAQERASRTQSSCIKLSNEVECLKVHIGRLEDKNEKLTFERTCSEDSLNKLRKINAELRTELEETLVMLMLRDRDITTKDILMDKMKTSHVENHKMIEGLQEELMRLQEHSHQVLLRYDRHCISPQSLYSRDPPNHRSLQSEMQDMPQHHKGLDDISLPSLHKHSDDIQSIIHRIKSEEITNLLHNKYSERDSAPLEMQEKPFPAHQQQQASIKQQLVNVLQELELHKCVWEEKGEKVEEHRRAWVKEQKQSQTQIPEAKKEAVVNWWKAISVEGAKTRTKETKLIQELSETQAKLRQAEQMITDMREQVCHLQASLRSAQECAEQKHTSRVLCIDKGSNTERKEADITVEKVVKDQRDAAVATDPVDITGGTAPEQEQAKLQVTADSLLATLRRMEVMVNNALETAELVRESEQRVCQVRVRMESITQRVEEALDRAAHTDEQLNDLEASITAPTQSPDLSPPADPGTATTGFMAEGDVEPEDADRAQHPPPSPAVPEVSEPPQLPMNGGTGRGGGSELREEDEPSLQESPLEQSDRNSKESCDAPCAAELPFIFPSTRSRPPLLPAMPTLPEEEEEDSPEELDSSSSSPSACASGESRAVAMTTPTIVYSQQANIVQQDGCPLEQARPHSPRARPARKTSGGPITTVDSTGNLIDLVKDQLPELQLSEEDRQKNLELLKQAKKVSDRFLTRRGRRSSSSLSDSPTGLSPPPTPSSSPCSSRSSSLTVAPQTGPSEAAQASSQCVGQHLEVPSVREQCDVASQDQEGRLLVDWKPTEKRKVSSGTLTPRFAVQKENCDLAVPKSPPAVNKADEVSGRNPNQAPATGVAKPVPRPPTQQAPCTAEIKTIGAFPPLMRAVSWDAVGSLNSRNGPPTFPPTVEETFSDKPRDAVFKSSGYKDLPTQPGSVQKLSKLREEHKLMRNQSVVGSKLPDLSEAAEQEKGPSPSPNSARSEATKEKLDAMPNISDVMLRKMKIHRGLPGCAPPLTEKEVENAFVQLSLAFRNDNYTLETRLKQAERERNLTEEDTEKELEEFKGALKITSPQWQNLEQREAYQRLIETLAVLHRLATRLSSRAEIVGAVRQEKRMNKATEVMMQYVENLKRTYEKDHVELMEFKKLANQNSSRCYGGSVDTGDDGVPRASRSMSLTLGKALPRRRVSVAVVPKFNLLNIPGQTPPTAGPGPNVGPATGAALPVLCEGNDVKASASTEATQPAAECGKSASEQESEPAKPAVNMEEIRAEIRAELKAKIEEESYNKGYQEGMKQCKALQDEKREEENVAEKLLEIKNKDEESGKKLKSSRRMEEFLALLGRICPKISMSRRLLLISLTLFVAMCVVISIFTFFSDYYNRREDT
ncbi:inositol 1,4,5-triphosphate receptor associated 2-like isoform X2 [Brachyistius frenatus]|uniref:inositol 1,4,5-triphosphate receptor associated 2-like isoform X2 n=1 Tax=Brachyistius frenatus TaxID=100188 RepID=UPI0037E942BD